MGVNNAPRSRQGTRRIDGLAGRDTSPETAMIQKRAARKGYWNPEVVVEVVVVGGLGCRECLLWEKLAAFASTAPVELIFLQADKAGRVESLIGGVSTARRTILLLPTFFSAQQAAGEWKWEWHDGLELELELEAQSPSGDHAKHTEQQVRECRFLLAAGSNSAARLPSLLPPRFDHSQQRPTSLTRPPNGKTNVYSAPPNTSAKAQSGRVERSRCCRSSTLPSELWTW